MAMDKYGVEPGTPGLAKEADRRQAPDEREELIENGRIKSRIPLKDPAEKIYRK